MIPAPLFSFPMLLLLLAPWLAVGLTLWLLLSGVIWWVRHRTSPAPQRPKFWRWPTITLAVLAMAGNAWGVVLTYQFDQTKKRIALQQHYRDSRKNFVLPEDFQYGELPVPQGSLINKYDAFDNGEPQRPLGLRGLDAVRFPHPVQVAGVWATAMDASSGQLELARDQRIGPVAHFDPKAREDYGDWVADPNRPYLECQRGQMARFHVPSIDYDIQTEFAHPGPDGPDARFRPSQWRVTECTDSEGPMKVQPPYALPGPKGAQAMVWGPLLPQDDDE